MACRRPSCAPSAPTGACALSITCVPGSTRSLPTPPAASWPATIGTVCKPARLRSCFLRRKKAWRCKSLSAPNWLPSGRRCRRCPSGSGRPCCCASIRNLNTPRSPPRWAALKARRGPISIRRSKGCGLYSKMRTKMSEQKKYSAWLEGQATPPDALTSALDALYGADPSPAAARRAQQAVHASLAGLLTPVYYDRLDHTPLGPIWLAIGARGLVAIEYNGSEANFPKYLFKLGAGQPQRSAARLATIKRSLSAYLAGDSERLGLEVDLSHLTEFQRRVLQETRKVPRGQVVSYARSPNALGSRRR